MFAIQTVNSVAIALLVAFVATTGALNRASAEDSSAPVSPPSQYQTHMNVSQVNALSEQTLAYDLAANKEMLEEGKEYMLRLDIAKRYQDQQRQDLMNFTNSVATNSDPVARKMADYEELGINDFINSENRNFEDTSTDPDALETQGVRGIHEAGARDAYQAALYDVYGKSGNFFGYLKDNIVKQQLFAREMDALQQAQAKEGTVTKVGNFLYNLFPLSNIFANLGNVPGSQRSLDPAQAVNNEITKLWALPLDQFKKQIPHTFENFTKTFFGLGQNLDRAVDTARLYANGGLTQTARTWQNIGLVADAVILVLSMWFLISRLALSWTRLMQVSTTDGTFDFSSPAAVPLGADMPKRILIGATVLAILMFVFPPTNSIFGDTAVFVGWRPLWTIGSNSDGIAICAIAYPILLIEWGLLALIAFTAAFVSKR